MRPLAAMWLSCSQGSQVKCVKTDKAFPTIIAAVKPFGAGGQRLPTSATNAVAFLGDPKVVRRLVDEAVRQRQAMREAERATLQ